MFSYFQAICIGVMQGVTELFPISSLGHSVILDGFLNWQMKQNNPYFLTFLVATHAATALVLFCFFWKDWWKILCGIGRSFRNREISEKDTYAKLGWLLIVGTIPAGILGLLFEDQLKMIFTSPQIVAGLLIINGIMLILAEKLNKSVTNVGENAHEDTRIARLTWWQTIRVGILQCLALLPGFSRTGATITGGLMADLNHAEAARFSFLLATPIIGAAALLKLPDLLSPDAKAMVGPTLAGALMAGVGAYFSVKFLEKHFQTNTLKPFGIYCVIAGLVTSVIFLFR